MKISQLTIAIASLAALGSIVILSGCVTGTLGYTDPKTGATVGFRVGQPEPLPLPSKGTGK